MVQRVGTPAFMSVSRPSGLSLHECWPQTDSFLIAIHILDDVVWVLYLVRFLQKADLWWWPSVSEDTGFDDLKEESWSPQVCLRSRSAVRSFAQLP